MNIAIITWHSGPNAGTFFQLYGLYTYLAQRGHHVEVINYPNIAKDFIARGWQYYLSQPLALIRRKIERQKHAKQIRIAEKPYTDELQLRKQRFDEMYSLMAFTAPVISDEDFAALNQHFDIFIVGSDQVWNASILNRRYLLDFVNKGKVKASYSPSIGSGFVLKRQQEIFKHYLKDFDYISTREQCLQKILQEKLSRPIAHLLDPSMLIPRDKYLHIAHLPKDLKSHSYLLCYFMPKNEKQAEQARRFAESRGLKLVIMAMHPFSFNVKGAYIYASAGPREFVGLIAHAAIVFSSSFHCTIFSIILHKDLYVFEQQFSGKSADINQRYTEQLDTYGMSHRYIHWGEEITAKHQKPIDYIKAETIFQQRLAESYEFLNQFC